MKLDEQDLQDITAALTLTYMGNPTLQFVNTSEYENLQKRCGDLHDRIQVIRRKNGTFESVD
jgi:hypothetical protein